MQSCRGTLKFCPENPCLHQGLSLIHILIGVEDEGNRLIQFHYDGIFEEILDQVGQMPLPPYITHQLKDKNRYQTVYAKHDGSAAAPCGNST